MKIKLITAALIVLLSACSTYGTPITQDKLAGIKQGETTRSEAVAILGQPLATTSNSDGTQVLSWGYSRVGFAGSSVKSQGLSVILDARGIVKSYSITGMEN